MNAVRTAKAHLASNGERRATSSIEDGIKISPTLEGVSETMLWTLYDRACEARRADSIIADPHSVRICDALEYDFAGRFGTPIGSFSARAVEFDRLLKRWLERHPDGLIISLGEGLETQAHRVDNGRMSWITVDLPSAIKLRERFLPSCARFRHVTSSACEARWADGIKPGTPVFIVAQGLFMYLEPEAVKGIFIHIANRVPGAEIAFDAVPRWFAQLTDWGVMLTSGYRLPPMPWGVDRDEIEARLRTWSPGISSLRVLEYRTPRGWPKLAEDLLRLNPMTNRQMPFVVHVKLTRRNRQ
ncbi:class I SAM-dependent methyltransferase [Cupriavidus sp. 2TAF22]|uniref:class I SAM-dependent methyltransferase n=1 Tax=unclassified Cupriavidus TaxID=2640874 RepID=UPI003F930153